MEVAEASVGKATSDACTTMPSPSPKEGSGKKATPETTRVTAVAGPAETIAEG